MINNHKSVRWRRIFSCNLLFIILTLPLTAQDILVTGKVIDAHLPISGANVLIINTTNGVVTDFDGRYRITAKPTDTLQISYLGYTTLTIPILNRSMINVTLQEDATTLGEVQINAGYYTTTDREKTGSIARITAKDIQGQPVNNPLEALIGRLTGVDVVPTSGVPGSGFEVKIRGQNSIMGGNAPLYIIDGVPFDSQSLGASNSSLTIIPSGNISPLNAINPATIESIEVLKDADATAIYGSRGANGVVLITTKKGKQGDTKFTINSSAGIANITLKSDLLNTAQYIEMRREAFANDGIATYPYDAYDVNGTWDQTRDTDWQEILIGGTAITRKLEASVSGGSERTQVLLSGMHQNETTVFPGDFNYDRISINSNLNHHSINKRFEMVFNSAYTIEDNHLPSSDLTSNALWLAPNAPQLYDDAGSLNWANNTWTNPLAQLEGTYTSSANTLIANAVLNYHVLDNLTLKLNTGYSNTVLEDQRHIPHTIYNPAFGLQSRISQSYSHQAQRNTFIAEPQLSWSFSNAQHSWQLLLGTTFQNRKEERLTLLGVGFSDNSFLGALSAANNLRILNENQLEYKYQSLFGRINYAFKKKLFLNVTARRDGSSRFSTGNRYGNFGAVGAAWVFSEDLKLPWLSFGKIRGSYGITGNDQIGDYQYLQTYTLNDFTYDGSIGLAPSKLYNTNFEWEENLKKEVALQLEFFKRRLTASVAFYNNQSSNQLINYTLPHTTGFASILTNLDAVVENSGWELELGATFLRSKNFSWDTSLNLTLPKNRLLEFPGLEESSYANRFAIGQPLNIYKFYHLTGVNTETGLFEFEDYNADSMLDSTNDRQYIADLNPTFFGGLSNSLRYKNWNLDLFFQFVKKEGINAFYGSQPAGIMFNQPVDVLDRWQKAGDIASMQQFTTGSNADAYTASARFGSSSGAISDTSFIRLKSLALSYSLPLDNSKETSCRLYAQGQNLFTFTKFKGGDPEQGFGFLPPLRRLLLGVQLQF